MPTITQKYRQAAVADLTPHPENPRQGDVGAIHTSIDVNGFYGAIVVQKSTQHVLAGNHRLMALQQAGTKRVPIIEIDVDDATARRILLADNRTSDLATNDNVALSKILVGLAEADDLLGSGYTEDDVQQLLTDLLSSVPPAGADDAPPLPETAESKLGEVYELGEHRLLCGDATDPDQVALIMRDEQAEVLWTDPPYGVDYESPGRVWMAKRDGSSKADVGVKPIDNDNEDGFAGFLRAALVAISPNLAPLARFYITASPGQNATLFRIAIRDAGWHLHQSLVWVKESLVVGHSDYHYRHEDVLYGWTPGDGRAGRGKHAGSRWQGDNAQTSVFEVPRPKRSEDHPTMKPVDLIMQMLANSSRVGDVVLDPFAGSGSTMVAAHTLQRRCVMIEIDPRYCDVIRERYRVLTMEHFQESA